MTNVYTCCDNLCTLLYLSSIYLEWYSHSFCLICFHVCRSFFAVFQSSIFESFYCLDVCHKRFFFFFFSIAAGQFSCFFWYSSGDIFHSGSGGGWVSSDKQILLLCSCDNIEFRIRFRTFQFLPKQESPIDCNHFGGNVKPWPLGVLYQ